MTADTPTRGTLHEPCVRCWADTVHTVYRAGRTSVARCRRCSNWRRTRTAPPPPHPPDRQKGTPTP